MQFHTNGIVTISYGGNLTRKEEREALSRLADTYRQWNENYRQTGSPTGLMGENERKGLLDNLPKRELRPSEAPPFSVELSPEAQQFLKNNALDDLPKSETTYSPVTEIRSEHFQWTEADGIEETITVAEELAARKEGFRQVVTTAISQSIGEILKPRATYEEAFDALYAREGVAWKSSFDDSTYGFTQILTPVNGAFGALATHLDDYLEQFGAEDGYFDTLLNALNELDTGDDNSLLRQIRDMVQTVKSGNAIDTQSDEFKRDVRDAIVETYDESKTAIRRKKDDKDSEPKIPGQAGLSYLDMERRKAKEEKQLLDKLTGKEPEEKSESAGSVFAKKRQETKDSDFRNKLRNVDEIIEDAPNDLSRTTPATEAEGTPLNQEDLGRLLAAYDTWDSISQRQGWGATKTERF